MVPDDIKMATARVSNADEDADQMKNSFASASPGGDTELKQMSLTERITGNRMSSLIVVRVAAGEILSAHKNVCSVSVLFYVGFDVYAGSVLKHLKKASDWLAEDFDDDRMLEAGPGIPAAAAK